jgi:hypothetical protein
MVRFKVVALDAKVANRMRREMVDEYGNALRVEVLREIAPCRQCLRNAQPGERMVLAGYSPFRQPGVYKEVGPIYIHADECEPYADSEAFPPEIKKGRTLTLRAYNHQHAIQDALLADEKTAEQTLERLLGDERVAYVHARNAAYGCFMCAVERV